MIKTLYIMRHAKASWDYPELPDYDRPLTESGMINSKKIATELQNRNVSVELIICSYAKRSHDTARIIATGINYPVEQIEVCNDIYEGDTDDFFKLIFQVNDDITSLMIVGHNPTVTQFVNLFVKTRIDILPTSGLFSLNFETENWLDITKSRVKTGFYLFP